jgi:predicted transcriptional regulator
MEKTTIYLPSEAVERLRETAKRQGQPQAALIRRAIEEFLERNGAPSIKSLGIAKSDQITGRTAKAWLRQNLSPDRRM